METITVEIDPKGHVAIGVKGAKGKSCQALTAGIEQALGLVVKSCPTPEAKESSHVAHNR